MSSRPVEDEPAHQSQSRTPVTDDLSRTNSKEKRCFQCNRFGHIRVNCPNREGPTAAGAPKGWYSRACDEITWNAQSQKYLCRGRLDGQRVQMLMDTGCDHTMVLASLVTRSAVDHTSKVPVLCVHGDTLFYPTVMVALRVGLWHKGSPVVVAPNLPVDVLLGNAVYSMENKETGWGLAVWTQAKRREMENRPASVSESLSADHLQEDPSTPTVGLGVVRLRGRRAVRKLPHYSRMHYLQVSWGLVVRIVRRMAQ